MLTLPGAQGGYKALWRAHPELCEPAGYTPMEHPFHTADLRVSTRGAAVGRAPATYSERPSLIAAPFLLRLQRSHALVKRAWERTTRTFSRKQQQQRARFKLRKSTGAGGGSEPLEVGPVQLRNSCVGRMSL